MKKVRFIYVLMVVVLLLVFARYINTGIEAQRERDLAQRLGVDRDAYPENASFPYSYFYNLLKPGVTTIKEVHEIVTEYELVLQCYRGSEVYYYYSKDDEEAIRYEIWYDNGKYYKMLGDDDSYRINTESCGPGLLPE